METLENFTRREVYDTDQLLDCWALDPLFLMIQEEEEFEVLCHV